MAKTQTAHVVITANAKAAVEVMKMLKEQTDIYIQRLDTLRQKKQQGVALTKQEEKEAKELEKKIQALTTAQQKNEAEYRKLRDVMKNISGSTTKDLKRAYSELAKMLNNTTGEQVKRQELLRRKMQEVQAQIQKNTGAINGMSKAQSGFGGSLQTTLKNLVAYAGVFTIFNKAKSLIEGVFKSNLKLSDSLANIRKVSGLTMREINQLYGNISKIDTRNTIETLNELAYTGAKLGIAEHGGTQALTGFVKAAEQVQMALGEDLGDEALPALAKLTEVMGLMDRYGVEQAMQKTASSIFQLGATSTATGKNIVEFSKRLMGLANVSRISADELLAIGSAADAMGLMPEVAATAFNKLFTAVQQNHNMIEKTLDLPKGRIGYWFEQGKTMNAIVEIFEAMNKRGNMNALDGVFKDLGSDGARLVAVMTTMADRVDILKKHLDTSTKAFKEGEAVIGEYMIQNQTAEALVDRASNLWAKAFTNPEGVTMVQQMAKEWYNLSKEMTSNQSTMMSLKTTIEAVALALRTVIYLAPFLIKAFAWAGVLSIIRGVGFGITGLVTQLRAATGAAMTLQVALKSNWVLAGVSAVAAVLTLVYEKTQAAARAAEEARERQAELDKQFAQSKETIEQSVRPLERYKASLDKANTSEEERNRLLKEYLAGNYQDYLDYLGIEIDKTLDLAKAYNMVVKTMKQKKAYEERESYRNQVNGQNRMNRIAAGMESEREARQLGLQGVDRGWALRNQGKSTQQMVVDALKTRYGDNVGVSDRGQVYKIETINKNLPKTGNNQRVTFLDVDISGLWSAFNDFQQAYRSERDLNRDVDDMFKDMVGDYDPEKWEEAILKAQLKRKGGLSKTKHDKGAATAARKAQQDAKQAMRKNMEDAQKNSEGVISKIEEWYRLQEAAIQEARADGQITEDEAKQMVNALNIVKNDTLATARRAVTTGDSKAWDEMKQRTMPLVQADASDLSTNLLREIQGVSIQTLHNTLKKFNGGKDVFGLDVGAFFDQMNAKAAGNTRESARLKAAITNEIEKTLKQYQFVEQANDKMRADLQQMGFLTETYEQWAKRMREGITERPPIQLANGGTISDEDAYRQMGNKFIQQGVINFKYNIENEKEAHQWVQQFATDASGDLENWAQAFPQLVEWIDLIKRKEQGETLGKAERKALEDAMPQIRNLYNEMMNHADSVNKATKQAFEHEKNMQDQRFQLAGYRDQEERSDRQIEMQGKVKETGIGQSLPEQLGLDKIGDDPEVLRIQNRIYWRNMEYEDARARLDQKLSMQEEEMQALLNRNATEEEIENLRIQQLQERAGLEELMKRRQTDLMNETYSLTTQVAQQMQKRVDSIKNFVKPVTDFTQAAGRKIGDMVFNMQSEEASWSELWRNMALAVGESVIQMGQQYAENLIMQQAMNRASETEAIADASVKTTAGIAAGSAKTIGELGWWGIPLVAVISALLMGLLQSALSTKRSTDSSSTSSAKKVKLVSGMLTYDEGNVGSYVGTDGNVYRATPEAAPKTGLVTQPIATTVQGNPALVAERGPEIVIGRQATRRILMDEPGLIRHLAQYDRTHSPAPYGSRGLRTYDEGTDLPTVPGDSIAGADNIQLSETLTALTTAVLQLQRSNATLEARLQQPIRASINKYGTGGLIDEVQSGLKFVEKYRK